MHNKQQGYNIPGDLSAPNTSSWHFCADYSTEKVQNNVLEYFKLEMTEKNYIEKGKLVLLPAAVYKEDNKVNFVGWELEDGSIVKGAITIEEAITLKAVFGSIVDLTFNDTVENPIKNPIFDNVIKVGVNDENYTLPIFERDNYIFLGWYDEKGNQYKELTKYDSIINLLE